MIRLFQKKDKVCEVVPYIYAFARRSKRDSAYKRTYRNVARHLSNFEKQRGITITSSTLGDAIFEEYIDYLRSLNLMQSTITHIVHKTQHMLRKMQQEGYAIDTSSLEIRMRAENSESVYITSNEIEMLHTMQVRGREQQKAKDLFLIGCLTGMRFSDYSKLTNKNIVGNTIQRKTKKTGEVVIVPMHRIVKEIINKYDGFPKYDNSLQNFNMIIKRICKRAGLNDKLLIEHTRGYKIERKTVKRYEIIGSHTARRSFATNTYLSGILPARIMLVTGHRTEQAFFKYIRINKKENARELSEHPFFR